MSALFVGHSLYTKDFSVHYIQRLTVVRLESKKRTDHEEGFINIQVNARNDNKIC